MGGFIDDLGIVIAAGGTSSRYGAGNKLLETLNGIPVFIYSIRRLAVVCPPGHRVICVPAEETAAFESAMKEFAPDVRMSVVPGGDVRMRSVYNGLLALPETCGIVAVHDAARPLADAALLAACRDACAERGGAVAGRPATDTVKVVDDSCRVVSTPDRSKLWTVETPQVFPLAPLRAAYEKAMRDGREFTDDAAVMEYSGHKPFLLRNSACNLKITYPDDLRIAGLLLS